MVKDYIKLLAAAEEKTSDQLSILFHENAEKIDTLIQLYDAYNRHIINTQAKRIRALKKTIRSITGDINWSDAEGLELEYNHFSPPVTIIAGFESTQGNPLGKFNIYITTPTIQAWNHYEDKLLNTYTNTEPQIIGNNTTLPVNSLPGDHEEQILTTLHQAYTLLSSLAFSPLFHSLTSH
jgi:hypothetical protein